MAIICAFFGHRNIPDDLEPRLCELVVRAVTEYGITEFRDGCYGEFDALAAQVVISLKARYPQLRLVQVYAYPPVSDGRRAGFDSAFCPDILDSFPDKWRIPAAISGWRSNATWRSPTSSTRAAESTSRWMPSLVKSPFSISAAISRRRLQKLNEKSTERIGAFYVFRHSCRCSPRCSASSSSCMYLYTV